MMRREGVPLPRDRAGPLHPPDTPTCSDAPYLAPAHRAGGGYDAEAEVFLQRRRPMEARRLLTVRRGSSGSYGAVVSRPLGSRLCAIARPPRRRRDPPCVPRLIQFSRSAEPPCELRLWTVFPAGYRDLTHREAAQEGPPHCAPDDASLSLGMTWLEPPGDIHGFGEGLMSTQACCGNCGVALIDVARYCESCGSPQFEDAVSTSSDKAEIALATARTVDPAGCLRCGTANSPSEHYCASCGLRLKSGMLGMQRHAAERENKWRMSHPREAAAWDEGPPGSRAASVARAPGQPSTKAAALNQGHL